VNHAPPSLRARQRQNTYVEIVRTAFELFASDGYDAVSIEAIAAAAGVSRATFFNYFKGKDALLLEIARARAARLRALIEEFRASGQPPSHAAVLALIERLTLENARITIASKGLMLKVFSAHIQQGLLLPAREEAIESLTEILRAIPGHGPARAKLMAETLFGVFLATMLEWLMRPDAAQRWLAHTMRARLELVLGGVE
jgi:AcrR family transcriptional regulator